MNTFTHSDFMHVLRYNANTSTSSKLRLQSFASNVGRTFDDFDDCIIKDLYTTVIDTYDKCGDRWQVARNTKLKNKIFSSEKFIESMNQMYLENTNIYF